MGFRLFLQHSEARGISGRRAPPKEEDSGHRQDAQGACSRRRKNKVLTAAPREDAATAEVSRSQLWQWVKHGVTTAEGKKVDKAYALKLLRESADQLARQAPKGNKYPLAAQYFSGQVTGEDYADFLTT